MTLPAALRGGRAAFGFLTVIPVGGVQFSENAWRWAAAWFPFVGAVVGGAAAGLFVLLRPAGLGIAAVGALALTILLTGAFHEDGLADSADALGGAYNREQLFAILKDSRVGTYGALALVVSVLLRASCLVALDTAAPLALVLVHCAARTTPVWMMATVRYASPPDRAKSRPVVRTRWWHACFATLFTVGLFAFFVFQGLLVLRTAAWILVTLLAIALVSSRYFIARAGGVTGDFLGATEQLNEATLLIVLAYPHGP